ncbi:MAG TPA: hypothetical protein VFI42_12990 [Thermomicrobiaceae bacterium]|nr:hypothetical protein [Thermomicrobiaceae bacterium]
MADPNLMTEDEFLAGGNTVQDVRKPAAPLDEPTAPEHSTVAAGTAAFGQGLSGGWTDELGAGVDTAISKVPGLRDVAEKVNEMGGGHPGLSPLNKDVPLDQRLAEYRQRNADMRAQHPVASGVGQFTGGVTQAFAPGIGAARAATLPGVVASGAATGAAAGAGFNENPDTLAAETVRGAGIGAALSAAGYGVQKFLAGAPARNDARQLGKLGITPKDAGPASVQGGQISSRADDLVSLVKRDPGLRAAAGKPREVVAAIDKSLQPLAAETSKVYGAADAAAPRGGMEPPELLGPLNQVIASAKGASVAYKNRLKQVVNQVMDLAQPATGQAVQGGGTAKIIPAKTVREFISRQLAPTASESETGAAQAVDDAAVALKTALRGYVGKNVSPEAATALASTERDISTYLTVQRAALRQYDKSTYAVPTPQPMRAAKRAAGAAIDKVAGAPVGAGRTLGPVATEGAQRFVMQRVEDALKANDPDAATGAVKDGIFGPSEPSGPPVAVAR